MSLSEYRCPKCGKLLVRSDAPAGRVEAFCRPCGARRAFLLGQPAARPRLTVQHGNRIVGGDVAI